MPDSTVFTDGKSTETELSGEKLILTETPAEKEWPDGKVPSFTSLPDPSARSAPASPRVQILPNSPSPTNLPIQCENAGRFAIGPTAIAGSLNAHNEGACDWGWQGFIGYGCQSMVVVIDAHSMTKIQTLDQHQHLVTHVKWARENYCHSPRQPYSLRLASADIRGNMIVWDVTKGAAQSRFSDSDAPICDMAWHWQQDATQDMLLVLHPNSNFVLWNALTGTIIWRKNYQRVDHLESFDLDPHTPDRVLFIAPDGVWMQKDLTLFKASNSDLHKITWHPNGKTEHNPSRDGPVSKDLIHPPISLRTDVRRRAARFLLRNSPTSSTTALDDPNLVVEIFFHKSVHDVLVAVYPRRIVLVSLRYLCPYRTITIDRSSADLLSILPLRRSDGFFCLHINGCVSFRHATDRRRYETVSQSESSRLMKQCKPYGFLIDPVGETKCSILINDGRILVWSLHNGSVSKTSAFPSSPLRLNLTHSLTPLPAAPIILQAAPRPSDPERSQYLAVGSGRGQVQLHNLSTNEVDREYFIQNSAVQGLKWISDDLLLVFTYPNTTAPTALVKSEISILNVITGEIRSIRKSPADESPIRTVKVSPTKEHFVITFKNGVPEVWSISDGRKLVWHRPRSVPQATAAEWVRVVGSDMTGGATRQELILFVDLNGLFQAYKVKGNIVHEDKTSVFATQTTIGHITAMCRKRNKIVMGDVDGSLIKWVPSESLAETKNLNRGWIKSIKFSPKERTMWAAVLFNDGLDVWEIETMELINQLKPKQFKVTSLDWVSGTHLALCCTDGIIRIFDFRNFHSCSSAINREALLDRVNSPYLLQHDVLSKSKSSLLLGQYSGVLSDRKVIGDGIASFLESSSLEQMSLIDRCLLSALLLGDESDYHFWKACMRAMPWTKSRLRNTVSHSDNSFLLNKDELKVLHFDIADSTIKYATGNAGRSDCLRRCVQDLVAFGESGRAVEYLLNLDSHEPHYYEDCLKAALLTALQSSTSETVQSTIKLIATNLIASSSFISAGVEILCSIGKIGDACRYLQSAENYEDAAVLASLRLSAEEIKDIYLRWVDNLCAPEINQRSFALLLCLHCGSLDRGLELMATSRHFERAAIFLRLCDEGGILEEIRERNPVICEAIYLEYARYLHGVGLRREALDFCDKGGKNGRLLRQEFEILNNDHVPV